ncbi:hypothetical protein [Kitasatospora sp. NPDC058218]|uniref:hypothetical protein n=1 Tax=Kitasatospora sp. NPDC058218 TaxID=3346385 RepID=UPI0036DCF246
MEVSEARLLAQNLLDGSLAPGEPEFALDSDFVRSVGDYFVFPYNSKIFLATRDFDDQVPGCWPIIVDSRTGFCRFSSVAEREKWRAAD